MTAIANANLIYEPKGRAREYAPLACNVYRGCDHACEYCYAPSATQRQRADFVLSSSRGPEFLPKLRKEAARYAAAGITDPVLLSFTCDPYQSLDERLGVTREAIQILHGAGLPVHILTKGGSRALRDLDLFTAGDAFASTLTLLDPDESARWEPGAASPQDRIETLRKFHAAGIPTWVSLEPVLDPSAALEIIRHTHSFVDLYKVGKLNYHPLAKEIDWHKFADSAITLLDSLSQPYYIKHDLLPFLSVTPRCAVTAESLASPAALVTRPSQLSMF
jgi:DNA repair photolyase